MSYLVRLIFPVNGCSWVIIIPKKIQETKHTTVTSSPLNRHQRVVIFHEQIHHVKSIHTHHSCGKQNLNPDVFGDLKSQNSSKFIESELEFGESDSFTSTKNNPHIFSPQNPSKPLSFTIPRPTSRQKAYSAVSPAGDHKVRRRPDAGHALPAVDLSIGKWSNIW